MKSKKAVVAGHICIDLTPTFPGLELSAPDRFFTPGKLIQTGDLSISTGGCVSNTGIAMKILGADVSTVGKIGCDDLGSIVRNTYKKYGIDSDLIAGAGVSTSYSVVLAPPGIDRIFLHHPGANDSFTSQDITDTMLGQADLFHFGYPPLMRSMYENDGAELISLFRRAKALGTVTSLDMALPDPSSPAGRVNWRRILERLMPFTDFFMPSIEELCAMLEPELYKSWLIQADGRDLTEVIDIKGSADFLSEQLLAMGAKVVMIKCGAPGLFLASASASELTGLAKLLPDLGSWSNLKLFEASYMPEQVLSATGAGDTSIAAFLTGLLNGYSPDRCLRLAAAVGASCVESYDALSGLKSFDILEAKIKSGWKKRQEENIYAGKLK